MSQEFRPTYGRLHELRALVPPGVPLLAATATITPNIRSEIVDKLDMKGCEMVSVSPDRQNIYYEVKRCSTIEDDLQPLVDSLRAERNKANRVIVYCRSLNTVANLYAHFLYTLDAESFHPLGAEQISDNRLLACIMPTQVHTIRLSFKPVFKTLMELFELFLQLFLLGWV